MMPDHVMMNSNGFVKSGCDSYKKKPEILCITRSFVKFYGMFLNKNVRNRKLMIVYYLLYKFYQIKKAVCLS